MKGLRSAYVVDLDLPDNLRAHAVQVMKNAQAWARASDDFEMITNVRHDHYFPLQRANLEQYFGLSHPFPVRAYPFNRLESAKYLWLRSIFYRLAARRCARRGVDLIYTRTNLLPLFSLPLGIPTIVESHSPPGDELDKPLLYQQMSHPHFLALVTISEPLAQRYRQAGLPEEKILVQPDGVDLDRFQNAFSVVEAKKQLALNPDRPLAVYVGHLYEGRGIEDILVAAGRLPWVDFLLVGGYPQHLKGWRNQAESQGVGNIQFKGFVQNNEVPLMLWAADVLLMPYSQRCPTAEWMSPLKMFEYMAAKRPIIATDLPALKVILSHHKNAWLVPPEDGGLLADAIAQLLSNPELSHQLAEAAWNDVQSYSWDMRVKNILQFVCQQGVLGCD
ncbi:MAG: glycosyltransferase [Magnetococcus sp. DMHC-6]